MAILPLSGIHVLDFSTLLPGPLASLILSEAGAQVSKLERPGTGEDMRHYPPEWDGRSATFALLNGGKSCIELDLKSATGFEQLKPLIQRADVLIEQFRPGVMARLGLDYPSLKAINPRLIYCSITGYGQSGDRAGQAGHDLNYMSDSGLLSLAAGGQAPAAVPPVLAADIAGGTYPAVMNILLALRLRDQTGEGSHIDISMTDNLFPFAFWALGGGLVNEDWPQSGEGLLAGGSPRYQLYRAACGGLVAVAALEDRFWTVFCAAIALDDSSGTPGEVKQRIADLIRRQSADHWDQVLSQADCCCNIVRSLEQAVADPHLLARGLFDYRVETASGASMMALPLPLSPQFRRPADQPRAYPDLKPLKDD